jgi:hypothetical protein
MKTTNTTQRTRAGAGGDDERRDRGHFFESGPESITYFASVAKFVPDVVEDVGEDLRARGVLPGDFKAGTFYADAVRFR